MAEISQDYLPQLQEWHSEGLSLRAIADRLVEAGGPRVDPKTIAARLKKPVYSLDHIAEPIRHLAMPTADLTGDKRNARRHPDINMSAIKGSLQTFGQMKPIVANVRGGKPVVIAGNGTLDAARSLGWSHIAVIQVNVSEATASAFALADNRTAELADWDNANLAAILMELEQDDVVDLASIGFDDDFVRGVLTEKELPDSDEWEGAIGDLPDGDKPPFQQMTFTLHDDQAQTVKEALDAAKGMGGFVDTSNENSNGNALARVCEMFLGANR